MLKKYYTIVSTHLYVVITIMLRRKHNLRAILVTPYFDLSSLRPHRTDRNAIMQFSSRAMINNSAFPAHQIDSQKRVNKRNKIVALKAVRSRVRFIRLSSTIYSRALGSIINALEFHRAITPAKYAFPQLNRGKRGPPRRWDCNRLAERTIIPRNYYVTFPNAYA